MGGWGGAPYDDDLIMFAALAEITDGWADEQVTWLYRQHAGQTIRDPQWHQWGDSGRKIALQRVRAARATALQLQRPGNEDTAHVTMAPPMKQTVTVDEPDHGEDGKPAV